MTEETGSVILRPYNHQEDAPLVFASWRNALWYGKPRDLKLSSDFYQEASSNIKWLLNRKDAETKIACLKDNPDMIIGYSVMIGTHLVFVYVKTDYRLQGIAKLLTKGFETVDEPETSKGTQIMEAKQLKVSKTP